MILRLTLTVLAVLVSLTVNITLVQSHDGGLDSFGCHNDRKHGGYHCHRGAAAGQQFSSQADMVGSMVGRSHEKEVTTQKDGLIQIENRETCIREKRTGKVICGDLVP
jgi:hypothetical protein